MLGFLFGLLIVVALVLLAIKYRPVRWLFGGIAALVLVGILWVVESERQAARNREAAKHLVSPQELQFEYMRLIGEDKLIGRVRNLSSRYTVTGAEVEITLKDCVNQRCDVVGQATAGLSFEIPPGQVRGVDDYVFFRHVPESRGTRQWDYRVTSVSAH